MLRASDNIYFAPAIPYKKLQGAMSYLPQGIHPDEILMLIDDTVFGSAKAGLCVTATGLFYKESFGDDATYLIKNISHVEADIGIINHGIVLNRVETLTFTQLDKRIVRTLASFLNEVCQGQTEIYQAPPLIDAELKVIIDLFAYFITFNMRGWDVESRAAISNHFKKLRDTQVDQYVEKRVNQQPNFDYENLLHRFAELKDVLSYKLRTEMIEQLVYAMALGQVEQTQADLFMTHLCRVSNVSKAIFPDLVKIIYQCLADEMNQSIASALNSEQLQACQFLDIPPKSLTEQSLQTTYRKKIAEFHPDKYQNLPESVRQLIESQAQQLNQARAILKRYLDNN
ncbi:molecular chaperone DnaJ [Acinetobacter sp. V102_4]|uniref:J domain-containing protein n=1 Tax=Acinetobacter sp. V102_4 TaxID=3072984 RepID=UPI00287D8DDC|nr:molecular chaperone DnaJ [Acinetobacter sp. V102_4]MDS7931564.1 molecular chaperone DnaJ [Acinetobacter sp. V102_4]